MEDVPGQNKDKLLKIKIALKWSPESNAKVRKSQSCQIQQLVLTLPEGEKEKGRMMLCGNLSRSSPRMTGLTEVKRAFQIYPYSTTVDKNVENVSADFEVAEVTRIQKIESWGRASYQEGKHGKGIHSHDATRGLNIRSLG